jgi:hypothetical protein
MSAAAATPVEQDVDVIAGARTPVAAVVCSWDGVRFSASASTQAALRSMIAEYIRRHADTQLWPDRAREVRALLDSGALKAGIDLYFARVGQRWDEEWLVMA